MQYVVLLANKRDTSERHWEVFNTFEEAYEYKKTMDCDRFISFIHKFKISSKRYKAIEEALRKEETVEWDAWDIYIGHKKSS